MGSVTIASLANALGGERENVAVISKKTNGGKIT